jgi:tetratricopeptide (TPR) repeat protein
MKESDRESYSFALVVGVGDYDTRLPFLRSAVVDAEAVRDMLLRRCAFRDEKIFFRHDRDATRDIILGDLQRIKQQVERIYVEDSEAVTRVVFYFSGHGVFGEADETILAVHSLDPSLPTDTGLSGTTLGRHLSEIGATQTLVLLDCCFAEGLKVGSSGPLTLTRKGGDPVHGVVYGSGAGAQAFESTKSLRPGERPPLSAFTAGLAHLVRTTDGAITLADLQRDLRPSVKREAERYAHKQDALFSVEGNTNDLVLAVSAPPVEIPEDTSGVLVLVSETGRARAEGQNNVPIVKEIRDALYDRASGEQQEPRVLYIDHALSNHRGWNELIVEICSADVAVFDLTAFEPAMMLLLGVRAVARRGVTLMTTSDTIDQGKGPFHLRDARILPPKYNELREAMSRGKDELAQLGAFYLDLPAYDAVRQLGSSPDQYRPIPMERQVLALCPFTEDYTRVENGRNSHWNTLQKGIKEHLKGCAITRTLDTSSPRLIGQELFEGIRRCEFCLVDWTGWRPDVFFEFGVRLAVSRIDAVTVIDRAYCEKLADGALEEPVSASLPALGKERADELCDVKTQFTDLLTLFAPTQYVADASLGELREVVLRAKDSRAYSWVPPEGALNQHHTFDQVSAVIQWQTDPIGRLPHVELAAAAQLLRGGKTESEGWETVLYPDNAGYLEQVRRSANERVLAAWYYISNRFSDDQIDSDADLKKTWYRLAGQAAGVLWDSGSPWDKQGDDIDALRYAHSQRGVVDEFTPVTELVEFARLSRKAGDRRERRGDDEAARGAFEEAIKALELARKRLPSLVKLKEVKPEEKRVALGKARADISGQIGGLTRRMGDLRKAQKAYEDGNRFERKYDASNSYNLVNARITALLYAPKDYDKQLAKLRAAEKKVREQVATLRRDDAWALADLVTLQYLVQSDSRDTTLTRFENMNAERYTYAAAHNVLSELSELHLPVKAELKSVVTRLEPFAHGAVRNL